MYRRAFTFIEVIIMSAVGLMLFGIFYSFFVTSSTNSRALGRKLEGIQASHLLLERLENDFKQAFFLEGVYDVQVYNYQSGIANAIVFYRSDPSAPKPSNGNPVKLERTEYIYDPSSSKVFINGRQFIGGLFKRVEFSFTEGRPLENPPSIGDFLTVTVTGIPDELAGKSIGDIDSRDLSTIVMSYSFRHRAMSRAYENWQLNRRLVGTY